MFGDALRPTDVILRMYPFRNSIGHTYGGLCKGSRQPDEVGLSPSLTLKIPACMNMTTELYTYLLEHTREPQVLKDLRDETAAMSGSHMQITRDQGQFMSQLVKLTGTRRAVELGVYTGYSSLVVAMALPEDGKLYAIDKDERSMAVARKYWKLSGVNGKVEERLGNAQDELKKLLEEFGPGSFDMGFIDADKRAYHKYFELMMELMRPGGLIVVDNVLFYGRVVKPEVNDKAASALADFNKMLIVDERIDLSIIPVGDGMALCRKR